MSAAAAKKRPLDDASAGNGATTSKAPKLAGIFEPKAAPTYQYLTRISHKKSYIHFVEGTPTPSSKVAAFDMDGCVITTKTGVGFPKDENDWKWWNPAVPGKIRALYEQGYAIVFISNQAGAAAALKFERKLPHIAVNLKIPFQLYAALGYDEYRKPAPGLWDLFVAHHNGGVAIDYEHSFFVGDAAGRPKDHSECDRQMAENAGLTFHTPEEYFLARPVDPNWKYKAWDARTWDHTKPLFRPAGQPLLLRPRDFETALPLEVILLVGFPGSGKTSFFKKYYEPAGYVHVNQDTLHSFEACKKLVEKSLSLPTPRSCIVDNTNPRPATRLEYLQLVREKFPGTLVRCFYFSAPIELAKHNSVYRALEDKNKESGGGRKVLPDIAFSTYYANVVEPTVKEGFDEVKTIHFRFEGDRTKWERWLGGVYKQPSWRNTAKPKAKGK